MLRRDYGFTGQADYWPLFLYDMGRSPEMIGLMKSTFILPCTVFLYFLDDYASGLENAPKSKTPGNSPCRLLFPIEGLGGCFRASQD